MEIFQELLGEEPAISPSVAETGAKRNVEPGDDTEPVSHLTETVASTSTATDQTVAAKPPTSQGSARKRKRAADKMPTRFSEFIEESKKTETAKLELLQSMHEDQQTAAAERLLVMKDLNQNIKALIDKL